MKKQQQLFPETRRWEHTFWKTWKMCCRKMIQTKLYLFTSDPTFLPVHNLFCTLQASMPTCSGAESIEYTSFKICFALNLMSVIAAMKADCNGLRGRSSWDVLRQLWNSDFRYSGSINSMNQTQSVWGFSSPVDISYINNVCMDICTSNCKEILRNIKPSFMARTVLWSLSIYLYRIAQQCFTALIHYLTRM